MYIVQEYKAVVLGTQGNAYLNFNILMPIIYFPMTLLPMATLSGGVNCTTGSNRQYTFLPNMGRQECSKSAINVSANDFCKILCKCNTPHKS